MYISLKYLRTLIRPGFFTVLALSLLSGCNSGRNPDVTVSELQDEIKYLSSDSLKGRLTGSPGDSLAAEYIKSRFIEAGLTPLATDGFQRFEVTDKLVPGEKNYLTIDGKDFNSGEDFMPFAFSGNSSLESDVIFAGYGLQINNDSLVWDDYKDLDVKGKWILILMGDPESDKTVSAFIPFSGDRDKALLARDRGASGVLMVAGPVFDYEDKFESLSGSDYSVNIPVLRIKRPVADLLLAGKSKTTVSDLENNINRTRKSTGFDTGISISGGSEIIREKSWTRNVVALLPGEDEALKNEYIIIGAHFDHLGMGGPGSSSRALDTIGVHHGADDNASGVSEMIELAQKFAATPGSHKRSIIFAAFTGEEEGLLGSKYFVENPPVDLSKVNVMINLDMVGRLRDSGSLQIGGVGTAEGLKDLVLSDSDSSLMHITYSEEGYGPSDHSSFYGKNIPVLFYTTGAHLDYHTPGDTWDKINYEGMVSVSDEIFSVARDLSNSAERLKFKEAGPANTGDSRAYRRRGPTLGIMPDFAGNVKNGLRADFVTPGRPAALGGMKKGDIIISINGKSVGNIQDYMFRMSQLKHGQTISVEVLRNNKKEVLLIQL
jgi:aminopeptidase YwaD